MNPNQNFSPSNISVIVRLRGPKNKNNNISNNIPNNPNEKPIMKTLKKTISSQKNNSKDKSKNIINKKIKNIGLDLNTKYTIFTCRQPSKTLIVSNKPIKGSSINDTFHTPNDLYDFSQSILKETSLLEFDKVYNETDNLNLIYNECIKDNISNLFHGKNSSIFFFGPIDGGKSYLLRGNGEQKNNEPGLLSRAINDILNLIELTKQTNINSNKNDIYNIKFSVYQIYFDKIHDLLSKEIQEVKCENYYDNYNKLNTNFVNLTQRDIKIKNDYDLSMQNAMQQRKNLSQILKVNELKRKSNLIISIIIEKSEKINLNPKQANEQLINKYSQINFIELQSSNFGLVDEKYENDLSMNSLIFKNTSNMFNSICDNIVSSIDNSIPKSESMLTLCLKDSLQYQSNIVFFDCVIPWEYPLNVSYKSLKFGNWLRNQVINNFGNGFGKKIFPLNAENNSDGIRNNYNINNPERNKGLKYINSDLNSRYIPNAFSNNNNMSTSIDCNDNIRKDNNNSSNENPILINQTPTNNNINSNQNILNNCLETSNNNISNFSEPKQSYQINYNTIPTQNSLNNYNELNLNYSYNNTGITNEITPTQFTDNNCNNEEKMKLKILENTIKQLEEQNCILNNKLDKLQCEQMEKLKNEKCICETKSKVCNDDDEIEKIKKEYIEMKGDNLMFQEDINRLSEINKHLEEQIKEERNRNLELAKDNERLLQENMQFKKDINNLCLDIKNNKISNNTFEETFKQKIEAESKIKDLIYNLNQLNEEKNKFEADNRIIVERYNELEKEYDKLKNDCCLMKNNYDNQVSLIDKKITSLSSEVEILQKQNINLRNNDEKIRNDYTNLLEEKNQLSNLLTEQKSKNDILNIQMEDIKKNFEMLLKEKEMEELIRQKEMEERRLKNESKSKLINELQNRIQNYRTENLKKKD